MYKLVCAYSKDSIQSVHTHRLIRDLVILLTKKTVGTLATYRATIEDSNQPAPKHRLI